MNDFEHRLRTDLGRAASLTDPRLSPADLRQRIDRRRRRDQRLVSGGVAALLVAGGVGAYTTLRDRPTKVSFGNTTAPAPSPSMSSTPQPGVFDRTLLEERTTPDGLRVKVWRVPFPPEPSAAQQPTSDPRCATAAGLEVELFDGPGDQPIAQAAATTHRGAVMELALAKTPTSGIEPTTYQRADGSMIAVVIVSGLDDRAATLTLSGGPDGAAPIDIGAVHDGTAVGIRVVQSGQVGALASLRWSASDRRGVAVGEGGIDVATVLSPDGASIIDHLDCSEPLPPAGVQPTDADASEAAIRTALSKLLGGDLPMSERAAAVDDPTGVAKAFEVAAAGFPDVMRNATVDVRELVFTDPDHATAKVDITWPAGTSGGMDGGSPGWIATAVRVNGVWKATRQTACRFAEAGGADCNSPSGLPQGTAAGPIEVPANGVPANGMSNNGVATTTTTP